METDKRELFLMEYEDLCKKHGMIIDACGCCNSPSITTKEQIVSWDSDNDSPFETTLAEHIKHLLETD